MHKKLGALAIAIAAFAMACSDPTMPSRTLVTDGVSATITPHPINFIGGGTYPADPAGGSLIADGAVVVCKTADAAGSFEFTMTVNGGAPQAIPGGALVLNSAGTVCRTIYTSTVGNAPASPEVITVAEAADQSNWALTGVDIDQYFGAFVVYPSPRLDSDDDAAPARGATVYINNDMARVITFTNDFTPPPTGNEGCTPGYWKQDQHLDSWAGTGFAPGDNFDTVFGDNWFTPDITLLQALELNGGGKNALARHAVAALLNSASAGVDYPMTTAEVIAAVQAAFDAQGTIESTKNTLAGNNELGCPLN